MKIGVCGIFNDAVQLTIEFLEQNLEVAYAKYFFNLGWIRCTSLLSAVYGMFLNLIHLVWDNLIYFWRAQGGKKKKEKRRKKAQLIWCMYLSGINQWDFLITFMSDSAHHFTVVG